MSCDAILKWGIFDYAKSSDDKSMSRSLLKWLESKQVGSASEAEQASGNFGIKFPIKAIPIEFQAGGGKANSGAQSWANQLSEHFETHEAESSRFDQEFHTANSQIIDAWRDCIKNSLGLISWVEQSGNPDELVLKLQLKPSYEDSPTSVKVNYAEATSTVIDPAELKKLLGESIGLTPYTIILKRLKKDGANFVIRTDNKNYLTYCSIDPISPVKIIIDDSRQVFLTEGSPVQNAATWVKPTFSRIRNNPTAANYEWFTFTIPADGILRVKLHATNKGLILCLVTAPNNDEIAGNQTKVRAGNTVELDVQVSANTTYRVGIQAEEGGLAGGQLDTGYSIKV